MVVKRDKSTLLVTLSVRAPMMDDTLIGICQGIKKNPLKGKWIMRQNDMRTHVLGFSDKNSFRSK